MFEHVTVQRDCNAITIPYGETVTLSKNSEVVITQALGSSYTINDNGKLLRVAGKDGDALGQEVSEVAAVSDQPSDDPKVNLARIFEQLKNCYDPEIPVNIVELGLIYDVKYYQLIDGSNLVHITMTLTSAGCGMGTVIAEEVKRNCLSVVNVDDVKVTLVSDPPWSYDMISDAAKLQLGLL